jgi:hypothetical protein
MRPVPTDDHAADHLTGVEVPALVLESSQGAVDLRELCASFAVVYVYPPMATQGVACLSRKAGPRFRAPWVAPPSRARFTIAACSSRSSVPASPGGRRRALPKRLTWVAGAGQIFKVFYPVFSPDITPTRSSTASGR